MADVFFEAVDKLNALIVAMQDEMRKFLDPQSNIDEEEFSNTIIGLLDGPAQREAQEAYNLLNLGSTIILRRTASGTIIISAKNNGMPRLNSVDALGILRYAVMVVETKERMHIVDVERKNTNG